jgi:REP element-mobilizing transposase RayT
MVNEFNFTVEALGVPVLVDLESCQIQNVASCPDEVHCLVSVEVAVSVGST